MNNALPHIPGELLQDAAKATLGDTSKNVINSYKFGDQKEPTSAVIAGRNQATGAQVAITNTGTVTQVSGSPETGASLNSVVVTGPSAIAAPSGKNIVSVAASIPSATGTPSFTLITDSTPPQPLVCPTVPTPVSVNCPPGFEPTNGPPLVSTEPGGCGGDNRYWYISPEPATPVLPDGAAEIQRINYDGYNYLLAQGDTGMPPGIGCAWKYGGVTTFGCREINPSFSSDGRLDPSGGSVATASGGCGGGNREWYRNEAACPIGSQLIESVDFGGANYKLCESEFPLAPGVGCGWKFGLITSDCSSYDGCRFGLNYGIEASTTWTSFETNDATKNDFIDVSTSFSGPSGDRHTLGVLSYPCSPSKPGLQSVTIRVENVYVEGSGPGGLDAKLYAYARQGIYDYFAPIPFQLAETFAVSASGYTLIYNGLFSVGPLSFSRFTGLSPGGATLEERDLNFAQAVTFGLAYGTFNDDYFIGISPIMSIGFVPNACQARFNY